VLEVAREIALDDVEVLGAAVEQGHEDRDGVHRAPTLAEAIRVGLEVRLVDRVEDGPDGFLDDAVPQGGDPQSTLPPLLIDLRNG
jgi:hypothetical protein